MSTVVLRPSIDPTSDQFYVPSFVHARTGCVVYLTLDSADYFQPHSTVLRALEDVRAGLPRRSNTFTLHLLVRYVHKRSIFLEFKTGT
jgi:hypothetical protein